MTEITLSPEDLAALAALVRTLDDARGQHSAARMREVAALADVTRAQDALDVVGRFLSHKYLTGHEAEGPWSLSIRDGKFVPAAK